jgi:hypothetical protein
MAWLGLRVVIAIDRKPTMPAALSEKYRIEMQQKEEILVASRTTHVTQIPVGNGHKNKGPQNEDAVWPPNEPSRIECDTDTGYADDTEPHERVPKYSSSARMHAMGPRNL